MNITRSALVVVAFFLLCAAPGAEAQQPVEAVAACCALADRPDQVGGQFCSQGFSCCGDGTWRCNDADGVSACPVIGPACGGACCDPLDEPGLFGNDICIEGATCCGDGTWRCNDAAGTSTCNALGDRCPATCCDPALEPGQNGNATCFEGHTCCASGDWACNDASGSPTCNAPSIACPDCCDPAAEPACIEGASCCADGSWRCNEGDGSSTCPIDGQVCDRQCCSPFAAPGEYGNPPCFEGATCCSDGTWACNDAGGLSTCNDEGKTCEVQCCDPGLEPGAFGNPPCFEGASCCGTGEWQCNDAGGQSTCRVDSRSCEQCCDVQDEPGQNGNPPCFEGASCCGDGTWACNDAGGQSTCGVEGIECAGCCDPADEPGQNGTPPCIEGASCCGDGTWACNNGAGQSTCPLPGDVCEPPCCDQAERPNQPGTPFCATGFSCCEDGDWQCYDEQGNPTCAPGSECPQLCGGPFGDTCANDQFCRRAVGQCGQVGICTDVPPVCPLFFDPVCGCDGRTYNNECDAHRAGVSIAKRGPCNTCGGFIGEECPNGEFCKFPDGECCCDTQGVCLPIPDACPAVCDPVCGCDGTTYRNECLAGRAGVSVEHPGSCREGGGLVSGVRFSALQMGWLPTPGALAYNVYKRENVDGPPPDYGKCLYWGLQDTRTVATGRPDRRELWIYQVTAVFEQGEGSMGFAGCTEREPAERCACTLPSDVGPCDAVFPRWYHDIDARQCQEFIWGGCDGNANNFETALECNRTCADACNLPPEIGPCEAAIPAWYYDADLGRCERFVYGGCNGNANNFPTLDACQQRCEVDITTP